MTRQRGRAAQLGQQDRIDTAAQSIMQRVLGESFGELAPSLQRYFGPIPDGHVGSGAGVFEVAGSRHRWLRPLLAFLASRRILFPELGRAVPFTVENRPGIDGSLSATRRFCFPGRVRTMEDTMTVRDGTLVDRLGRRRGLEVDLHARVDEAGLRMRSTRLGLRVGRLRIPLPRLVTVTLRERVDPSDPSHQRVEVRIVSPLLGEVFSYAGTFGYAVA